MCVEVRFSTGLGGADAALDRPNRTLILNAALPPLQRTAAARALLLRAGVPQVEPGPVLVCLCGGPLVVEQPVTLAG